MSGTFDDIIKQVLSERGANYIEPGPDDGGKDFKSYIEPLAAVLTNPKADFSTTGPAGMLLEQLLGRSDYNSPMYKTSPYALPFSKPREFAYPLASDIPGDPRSSDYPDRLRSYPFIPGELNPDKYSGGTATRFLDQLLGPQGRRRT